jgi:hypothetical protein
MKKENGVDLYLSLLAPKGFCMKRFRILHIRQGIPLDGKKRAD